MSASDDTYDNVNIVESVLMENWFRPHYTFSLHITLMEDISFPIAVYV